MPLCCRYDAHINVEVCTGVRSVKYLHKYLTKGPDRCAITITTEDNGSAATTSNDQPKIRDEVQVGYKCFKFFLHLQKLALL